MTAVEWLIEEIHKNICFIPVHIQEQAKEILGVTIKKLRYMRHLNTLPTNVQFLGRQ